MLAINPSTGANRCADTRRCAALDALGDAVDWAHGGVSPSRLHAETSMTIKRLVPTATAFA